MPALNIYPLMNIRFSRRHFLQQTIALAAGAPLAAGLARHELLAADAPAQPARKFDSRVAIVQCRTYTPAEVRASMDKAFDSLGSLSSLVKNKTVTVKLNLTGT